MVDGGGGGGGGAAIFIVPQNMLINTENPINKINKSELEAPENPSVCGFNENVDGFLSSESDTMW